MTFNTNDFGKKRDVRQSRDRAAEAPKSPSVRNQTSSHVVKKPVSWREAALAAGHQRIEMFLSPEGAKALAAIKAFTNVSSDKQVIERLIIGAARSLRKDANR